MNDVKNTPPLPAVTGSVIILSAPYALLMQVFADPQSRTSVAIVQFRLRLFEQDFVLAPSRVINHPFLSLMVLIEEV
jgi:hypothetical protein